MHELSIKYCTDGKAGVESTVKSEIVDAHSQAVWKARAHKHVLCTIAHVRIYKVSSFQLFASRSEVEAEWGQRKEKRIVFVFNLPAAGFRLLSDVHIEQRACRALRAGSLIVEGKKTWLESSEASAALLIIMSSLQVSQRAVGGGWGRGR